MIQITLANPQVTVQTREDGLRLLLFVDTQSGIQVAIPIPAEHARKLGAALSTTIEVAPPGTTVEDIRTN